MNTTKYRLWRLLAVLLTLTLVAAACGDDDDSSSEETSTEETSTEEEEPAEEPADEPAADAAACNLDAPDDGADITLIYWSFEATEFYADEVEKCGEVDNISISRETGDFEKIKEDVDLGLAGGGDAPFDIVHASNPELTSGDPTAG